MTRWGGRRGLYLTGAVLLVVLLVGGRWLAIETAERAWAGTFTGGGVLVEARRLGHLLRALVLLSCIAWATGNLLIVYRAIGSVQMPRRLGNLEIVEAIPHRVLFWLTLLVGALAGLLLSLGAGDWWRQAILAAAPPHFGETEPIFGHDVGYYVAVLPWRATLQARALLLTASAVAGVALLYAAIGSLRFRRARVRASDRARAHLGILLACFALVIAWGAALDPAQVVAGLRGPADLAALTVRVPASVFVVSVAVLVAMVSLVWAWRDLPNLIVSGWAALLLAVAACYVVIPGVVRSSATSNGPSLYAQRAGLERSAFGLAALEAAAPPAFPTAEIAARSMPIWDADRVADVVGAPPLAVALRPQAAGQRPAWLVAPVAPGPGLARVAVETDTGLAVRGVAATDSALWFSPGARGIATVSPDTAPALREAGIALAGTWRRVALAWTLQSAALARGETDGHVLLWRRDVVERLSRLAPFAAFGRPAPVIVDGALWWTSWGYVTSDAFPLARPLPWRDRSVRYLRAGLLGAVRVATGETRLWLVPDHDSLTAAWTRQFAPLIEPAARLPAELVAQLPYPDEAFRTAVSQLLRGREDSAWTARPVPFQIVAPGARLWTAVGLESGAPARFEGLLAGTVAGGGARLTLWRPAAIASPPDSSGRPASRLPGELVGSDAVRPGALRIWRVDGAVVTIQAQFVHPVGADPPLPHRVAQVYMSVGARDGHGPTVAAALRGEAPVDTSLAARWARARRLAVQADAALGAGDLELFGRLFRQLVRQLAPAARPR